MTISGRAAHDACTHENRDTDDRNRAGRPLRRRSRRALIETDGGWSPYLSLADAEKIEAVSMR
jgi:hypothetical protein